MIAIARPGVATTDSKTWSTSWLGGRSVGLSVCVVVLCCFPDPLCRAETQDTVDIHIDFSQSQILVKRRFVYLILSNLNRSKLDTGTLISPVPQLLLPHILTSIRNCNILHEETCSYNLNSLSIRLVFQLYSTASSVQQTRLFL